MIKAKDIAYTRDLFRIHLESPLLLAFNIMASQKGIYRLTVTDSEDVVKGTISGLNVLSFLVTNRGNRIREKAGNRLDLFLKEPISIFMEESIHKLPYDFGIEHLIQYMSENDVGYVTLIDDKGRLVGVITEGCIISKLKDGFKVSAEEIMSSPVKSIHPSDTVRKAIEIMVNFNIRRIVVEGEKDERWIVAATDIIQDMVKRESHIEALFGGKSIDEYVNRPISEINVERAFMVSLKLSVSDIVKAIAEGVFKACLVVKDGRVQGIVTEKDIATKLPKIVGVREFIKRLQIDI